MKLTQLFKHNPEAGIVGDCFRTCLAMLLGYSTPTVVPHFVLEAGSFAEDGSWVDGKSSDVTDLINEYLKPMNLYLMETPFNFDSFEDLLYYMGKMNPGMKYMVVGKSKNNTNHVIVCIGDEVYQDPAIDKSGIIGPANDGFFWISVLVYNRPD